MITSSNNPRNEEQYKELTSLALRGLRLLSSWTAQVMELVRKKQNKDESFWTMCTFMWCCYHHMKVPVANHLSFL